MCRESKGPVSSKCCSARLPGERAGRQDRYLLFGGVGVCRRRKGIDRDKDSTRGAHEQPGPGGVGYLHPSSMEVPARHVERFAGSTNHDLSPDRLFKDRRRASWNEAIAANEPAPWRLKLLMRVGPLQPRPLLRGQTVLSPACPRAMLCGPPCLGDSPTYRIPCVQSEPSASSRSRAWLA